MKTLVELKITVYVSDEAWEEYTDRDLDKIVDAWDVSKVDDVLREGIAHTDEVEVIVGC